VFKTLKDRDIKGHYQRLHVKEMAKTNPHLSVQEVIDNWNWDRTYTIWFGDDEDNMPTTGKIIGAVFMPWPREIEIITNSTTPEGEAVVKYGNMVPFPGILYREILAQQQTLGDYDEDTNPNGADYDHGVCNILEEKCMNQERRTRRALPEWMSSEEDDDSTTRVLRPYCYQATCCGDRPPECCRDRRHIKEVMQENFPNIEYFRKRKDGELYKEEPEEEEEEGVTAVE
jgi:hypothetical protein